MVWPLALHAFASARIIGSRQGSVLSPSFRSSHAKPSRAYPFAPMTLPSQDSHDMRAQLEIGTPLCCSGGHLRRASSTRRGLTLKIVSFWVARRHSWSAQSQIHVLQT
eukprot:scaffold145164_cov32-Tisochrysis_lutea.AAC.5